MTERALLRHAAAHVLVADADAPELPADADHHLFRVLRLRDGELVTVTDGCGAWRAMRVSGGELEADGDVHREPRPADPLTIAVAVPKRDRPEWIVQKLTELGVDRIVVLHAERSVVRWAGPRADKHLAKLRRVAVEALQQSRGVWLPTVDGPVDACEILPEAVVAEPGGRDLESADRLLAVGPEGGWSEAELAMAADRVSLGPTILRVETAALSLAAWATRHRK